MKNINPNPFTTRPEIEGTFGVVTSTHWIATAVGMAMLERGGNAFDAAVATAFTLQVVEPHLNGPGGDVPIILHDVRKGRTEVICGQGPAPAKATIAHYRSLGLDMVPGTGLLAACVPGMFDTWMLLLRDYGTLRIADVLAPAIFYASQGHPLVERAHATIATVAELFRKYWPTSAAVYLPGGKVPETGALFTNTTLAETYARVLREAESAGGDRVKQIETARKTWSQGFVAEAIDRFCRTQAVMDTSGEPHRGVLTGDDMARWHAHVEAPLAYDYGRYTVCKPGPWAQGPVMLQQLALLKGFDLDERRPDERGFRPSAGRVLQARLRRSREVLRRSRLRRGADGDAALGRLQRRAAQAGERDSLARIASGLGRGFRRGGEAAARGGTAARRRRHGRGRADRRPHRRDARRHRAFRHRRRGRQHGVGDAVRRLAAILAGHSRARLLPRHPRADVLAGGGASRRARARQAAAHDALAHARAARRRSPIWPGARPAATSRINGPRSCSCATSTPG